MHCCWYCRKETLCVLSQDTSILLCKPGKENGVVVSNKKYYMKKMGTILKNKTNFNSEKVMLTCRI